MDISAKPSMLSIKNIKMPCNNCEISNSDFNLTF